jgi:superfamily II DNA or RNA helicase
LKFRTFHDARTYAHSLNLKNVRAWEKYCRSDSIPSDIPKHPNKVYKNEGWISWGDWLGTFSIWDRNRKYLPFKETRDIVRSLNLLNQKEWKEYCKSGKKPNNIPGEPNKYYKDKGWISWGDWFGTNYISPRNQKRRPFNEAREFIRSLNLLNQKEWEEYYKSGKKPADIPSNPEVYYKDKGWISLGDWLGTFSVAPFNKKFRSFEEARKLIHSLNLPTVKEWEKYCRSGKLPDDIPAHPDRSYKDKGWVNYGDWLGTNIIADRNKKFRSFEEARKFARSLNLSNVREWEQNCNSDKIPDDIPRHPDRSYKDKGWVNYGDWLGTDFIATRKRKYRPFIDAREYVHSLHLSDADEYREYFSSGKIPDDIPSSPHENYKDKGWISWGDWLGTGSISTQISGWSIEKVKGLIKDLIENKVIYEWSDDERYHLLLSKGVLNLASSSRYLSLFKDLIIGPKTEDERKKLEEFVNSDQDEIPEIATEEEIQIASTAELAEMVNKEDKIDPLEDEKIPSPKKILAQTEYLESVCEDIELMQFFVTKFVNKLWKGAFNEIEKGTTANEIRRIGNTGKKFHDTVTNTFLTEYDSMESIEIPKGYAFPHPPNLMQRYVAYRIHRDPYFGNFSETGTGKTLSAILASRVIDSKMTLVVCPNDVVDQWAINKNVSIPEIFPNSKVVIGKKSFLAKYDKNQHQYLVINYDKFSQNYTRNLISNLVKEKIDFVILDEIHFIKRREEKEESKRRQNLGGLLTEIRKKNNNAKVLGLSATPVINHLMEGRSLLEYITGKVYDDLATRPTVPNAMALFQKLLTISIRQKPKYKSEIVPHFTEVYTEKPQNITSKQIKHNPLLIEQILTDARLPEIIKRINGQTIIYTEKVTEIVDKLKNAVENAGYTFSEYTGKNKQLMSCKEKRTQVLIASMPISTGVDGLQDVCNNLIINTLPWTNAQYKQLIGRLHRLGQQSNVVNVHIIKAIMSGYKYDEAKWYRIEFKRTLTDCAVDGKFPKSILQTKDQMQMELIKWLERLERNEISTFQRRNLNVVLTPTQKLEYTRKTNEFSKLNNRINTQRSETTNKNIQDDPQLLIEYHRQFDEIKKGWDVHPVNVIANKINELKLPAHIIMKLVIGDFGCGKGELMELLKENKMYIFDHHNILNEKIISCDMKSVPIKDEKLDIAIFSLSLMGTNWPDYIVEAKRCLTKNGFLFIAETTKSLRARLSELRNVIKDNGFQIYEDEEIGDFTFIQARKL